MKPKGLYYKIITKDFKPHHNVTIDSRDRSSSSDRLGVSPATRKQVVFAGIDDDGEEDDNSSGRGAASDSDTGGHEVARRGETSEAARGCDGEGGSEEVWIKRPELGAKKEDDIPVTGTVFCSFNFHLVNLVPHNSKYH